MTQLERELDENYRAFHADWTAQFSANAESLKDDKVYRESYRRLACLNTIRSELVAKKFSVGSAAFFLEAQNDALISHVNASIGSWRTSLQALRSFLENVLCSLYYKDHPVELELWSIGKFWIGFSELHAYAASHPSLAGVEEKITALPLIKKEYSLLSKAVHASGSNFRMTGNASEILLWSTSAERVGMWATREREVVEAVSMLFVSFFRAEMEGTKLTALRNMLYFTIGAKQRAQLKSAFRISIPKP